MLQGCRGPVHGVIAEHWAVYTYWNALERRPQVTIVHVLRVTKQSCA